MKTTFEKAAPKTIIDRDMKQFEKLAFKRDLKESLKKLMYRTMTVLKISSKFF